MTTHNLYSVSNITATPITPGKDSGFDITIQNVSAVGDLYLGSSTVSSTNYGFKLVPGAAFSVELAGEDDLFAIASQENTQAAVLRVNLERSF